MAGRKRIELTPQIEDFITQKLTQRGFMHITTLMAHLSISYPTALRLVREYTAKHPHLHYWQGFLWEEKKEEEER